MEIACTKCGGPVQKATVIVQNQTSSGSHSGIGYVDGQSVRTSGTVHMQSDLARNLSADQPKQGGWCLFAIVSLTAMILPFCMLFGSFQIPNEPNGQIDPAAPTLLIASIIVWFAMIIAIIVGSKMLKRRHTRKYNQWWWSVLDRRYFCYSCGTIINV